MKSGAGRKEWRTKREDGEDTGKKRGKKEKLGGKERKGGWKEPEDLEEWRRRTLCCLNSSV